MTVEQAKRLKPGDKVRHVDMDPNWEDTVGRVDSELFPDDPVVFFPGGGFWRSSRLRRAAEPDKQERTK